MGTFEQWQYCALFLVLPKASLGEMRRGSIALHRFRFFYTPPPQNLQAQVHQGETLQNVGKKGSTKEHKCLRHIYQLHQNPTGF